MELHKCVRFVHGAGIFSLRMLLLTPSANDVKQAAWLCRKVPVQKWTEGTSARMDGRYQCKDGRKVPVQGWTEGTSARIDGRYQCKDGRKVPVQGWAEGTSARMDGRYQCKDWRKVPVQGWTEGTSARMDGRKSSSPLTFFFFSSSYPSIFWLVGSCPSGIVANHSFHCCMSSPVFLATCFKYCSRGLPAAFFPDIAPSRMFTTNSLCLIVWPIH